MVKYDQNERIIASDLYNELKSIYINSIFETEVIKC